MAGNGICRECQRPYGKHYAGCSLESVNIYELLEKARTPHPTDVFTIYQDEKFADEDSYAVLVTFDSQADRDALVHVLGGARHPESEPGVPSGRGYE
jgi:hypothetical protein